MRARCGKSPTADDQLGAQSAGPACCHGLFGLLLLLLLFIEPRLLRVRSQWCTTVPRPHKHRLLPRLSCSVPHFLTAWGVRGAVQSQVTTDHVFEVVASRALGSSHLPASSGLEAVARVTALWGFAPAVFARLFTCRLWFVSLSICLSATPFCRSQPLFRLASNKDTVHILLRRREQRLCGKSCDHCTSVGVKVLQHGAVVSLSVLVSGKAHEVAAYLIGW